MNYKNIIIITILATLTAYFYDLLTAVITWGAYIVLVFAIGIKQERRRNKMEKIDKRVMMQEAQKEVSERVAQGKAKDRKEAMHQMKQDGFWTRLVAKLRGPPLQAKTAEEKVLPKEPVKEKTSTKMVWSFGEDYDDLPNLPSDDITVEVAKEKGNEYSALVKNILASGTINWNERVAQLDELKTSIENTVKQLKTSYDEIRHERILVDNLAKLKQKRIE